MTNPTPERMERAEAVRQLIRFALKARLDALNYPAESSFFKTRYEAYVRSAWVAALWLGLQRNIDCHRMVR